MRIKLLVTGLSTVLLAAGSFAQSAGTAVTRPNVVKNNFTITTDLTELKYPVKKLFISWYNNTSKVRFTDSSEIGANRKVTFTTYVEEPILAQVWVVPADAEPRARVNTARDYFSVFIEPGNIKLVVKDSVGNAVVTGSGAHLDYLKLKANEAAYDEARKQVYARYAEARKTKDAAAVAAGRRSIDSLQDEVSEKVFKGFALSYKTSPVALYALSQYAGYDIDAKKVEPVFNQLGTSLQQSAGGKAFKERIELAKKTGIGQAALEFTQNDTAGIAVSLASFKGKYVLIDFWASWCGPCRAENPNVVKAFNQYKEKGFTVLGVSLDKPGAKDKWLEAIHHDQLTWTHVSDLAFWNNAIAKQYGVLAIPQNYLIDPNGKIVAKNIRGEALTETLSKLLD